MDSLGRDTYCWSLVCDRCCSFVRRCCIFCAQASKFHHLGGAFALYYFRKLLPQSSLQTAPLPNSFWEKVKAREFYPSILDMTSLVTPSSLSKVVSQAKSIFGVQKISSNYTMVGWFSYLRSGPSNRYLHVWGYTHDTPPPTGLLWNTIQNVSLPSCADRLPSKVSKVLLPPNDALHEATSSKEKQLQGARSPTLFDALAALREGGPPSDSDLPIEIRIHAPIHCYLISPSSHTSTKLDDGFERRKVTQSGRGLGWEPHIW